MKRERLLFRYWAFNELDREEKKRDIENYIDDNYDKYDETARQGRIDDIMDEYGVDEDEAEDLLEDLGY